MVLIGELSRRTGVSPRLLRYYEQQELLVAERDTNGYRCYGEEAPARVERVRELLDAGLPTREIRELLPCAARDGLRHCDHSRSVLGAGLDRLDGQIADLEKRRRLLADQVEQALRRPVEPGPALD